MNKYVNKIIDLYTKSKIGEPAREEFHKWLIDNKLSSEKEEYLFHLWNNTENVATENTISSLASLQIKSHYAERKNKKLFIWRYAAAIAAIIAISSVYLFTQRTSTNSNFIEYFSQAGEAGLITLPDGSLIQTNSGTVILYPESYGQDTRTIYLLGEANFKVEKNPDIPFIVKSKDFSVTALGTEFDVSSYPDDPYFKTTLISGSVKVKQNNNPADYILTVSEQFVYNKQNENRTIAKVDLYEATAWQRGELVFRGSTIREVLNVLERKFTVSFQYKSNVFNDDKYNFRFKKESSLSDIMDIIKQVTDDFDYKKIDDSYYINSIN